LIWLHAKRVDEGNHARQDNEVLPVA
jgi:hypothetical protein